MAKPDLIKWVSGDEAARISNPSSSKKLAGFLYKEKPPFQYLNWFFNQTYKWFKGLQGSYFDVVVGSATQVTNLEATHNITDLDDALVTAGTKVLFLNGTHTLTSNLSLTNDDIQLISESSLSIIDVVTFTITLSGLRTNSKLRVINAGDDDVIVSGAGSKFIGINIADNVLSLGSDVNAESLGNVFVKSEKIKKPTKDWGTVAVNATINIEDADLHVIEVDANITLTFAAANVTDKATIAIHNNGGYTITVAGIDNNVPTLTTGINVQDILGLIKSHGKITTVGLMDNVSAA